MQEYSSLTQALKTSSMDEMCRTLQRCVKTHPQDLDVRRALFKLYCVEARWDKALLQLQVLSRMDSGSEKQAELYKNLVFSELQREQVLIGERQAATLQGDIPLWVEKLHQANELYNQGDIVSAGILRHEAFEIAPESSGRGESLGAFSWIADSDSRIGPICEFICAGGYRWVPYSSIQQLSVSKPEGILDLLWISSTINIGDDVYHGFIPARYPVASEDAQDYKLGTKTDWTSSSDVFSVGRGRKSLITSCSECSIMEAGNIVFR